MLVHQGEVPPLARLGPGERVADHALDPEAVLTLTSVAISAGVPTRRAPPLPV